MFFWNKYLTIIPWVNIAYELAITQIQQARME